MLRRQLRPFSPPAETVEAFRYLSAPFSFLSWMLQFSYLRFSKDILCLSLLLPLTQNSLIRCVIEHPHSPCLFLEHREIVRTETVSEEGFTISGHQKVALGGLCSPPWQLQASELTGIQPLIPWHLCSCCFGRRLCTRDRLVTKDSLPHFPHSFSSSFRSWPEFP